MESSVAQGLIIYRKLIEKHASEISFPTDPHICGVHTALCPFHQTASELRLDEAQRLIGELETECRLALVRDEQCRAHLGELTQSAAGADFCGAVG